MSELGGSVPFEVTITGATVASCDSSESPCSLGAGPEMIVLVTPNDVPPYATVSWTGCDSVSDHVCTISANEDTEVTGRLVALGNLIFITEAEFTGDLGGYSGASAKCQAAAEAESLPGTFVALLHDGDTGPDLSTEGGPPAQGFISPAGDYIAHTADQVLRGDFNRLIPTEKAVSPGYRPVWLNLDNDGQEAGDDCGGFAVDEAGQGGIVYSLLIGRPALTLGCHQEASLFCVATDGVYDLDAPGVDKVNDYVFFLSKNAWAPSGGGRNLADLACASEAADAGLTGTYQAYLSLEGEFAGDRIDSSQTYVRGDGTPFLSSVELSTGIAPIGHAVPLNIHADGTSTPEDLHAFVGGDEGLNCNSFTTNLSVFSRVGRVNYPRYSLEDIPPRACNLTSHLYCFRAN